MTSERLSDERVREIAETYLRAAPTYLYDPDGERLDLSEDEVESLAREVLDLRATLTATEARLAQEQNTAKGLGMALGEALSQRDRAVAIAREAVELAKWFDTFVGWCTIRDREAKVRAYTALAAKLATLTGEG